MYVTYTLDIPVVVKQEKVEEDDDLQIVEVTPATKNIINIHKVKTEKTTPPMSPKKGTSEDTGNFPPKTGLNTMLWLQTRTRLETLVLCRKK